MAQSSYVESQLGGVDATLKRALKAIFDYVLSNLRFGPIEANTRAENLTGRYYHGTTHATPNTEFSVKHELQVKPYMAVQVIDLTTVNSVHLQLTVTKAADAERIYLSSPVASATFAIYVEG